MNDFMMTELAKDHHRRLLRAAEADAMRRAAEGEHRPPARQRRRRLRFRDR